MNIFVSAGDYLGDPGACGSKSKTVRQMPVESATISYLS